MIVGKAPPEPARLQCGLGGPEQMVDKVDWLIVDKVLLLIANGQQPIANSSHT